MENAENLSLEDAIIDLYLNVKIRQEEEIDAYTPSKYAKERVQLKEVSPFIVLGYIRSTVEILMSLKIEENVPLGKTGSELSSTLKSEVKLFGSEEMDLEKMLQKSEAEVREHISVEHQLKLYIDQLQGRQEKADRELQELKSQHEEKLKLLQIQLENSQTELNQIKKENE